MRMSLLECLQTTVIIWLSLRLTNTPIDRQLSGTYVDKSYSLVDVDVHIYMNASKLKLPHSDKLKSSNATVRHGSLHVLKFCIGDRYSV